MNLENTFVEMAIAEQEETEKPTLIICDRGILDGSAYVDRDLWH